MRRIIIKNVNNDAQKLGKILNIFTYLESLKSLNLILRTEVSGYLAPSSS